MFFKFRPNIIFRRQERDLIYVVSDFSSRVIEIPGSTGFNFSSLVVGVPIDKVPTTIMAKLQQEELCEIVTGPLDFVPTDLSFLKKISHSEMHLKKYIENIRASHTVFLNLTTQAIQFSQLEKYSKVSFFSEISAFQDFMQNIFDFQGLVVVLTNHHNHPLLEELNKFFLEKELSWVLVKQDYSGTTIGPYFNNSSSEKHHCYHCFLSRSKSSDEANYFADFSQAESALEYGFAQKLEFSWVEIELLKFHAGSTGKFERRLQLFDGARAILPVFQYLPAPLCEVCNK